MERMTQTTKKNRNYLKIALYQPDIPQNTAAIIRLCACFKTRLDIIEPCGFLLNDKKFKRVSMDYINSCEIKSYINFQEFMKNRNNGRIILMTTKAKTKYHNFKFNNNDTILFGRESAGVPEKIHKLVDNRIKIPLKSGKRSLNIASSVAIVLAESMRQNKII